MWHIMYHSGLFHLQHLVEHLPSQPKATTFALHSKYNYANNGDTTPDTNNGVLKILLGHIYTKAPMVLVIYLGYNFPQT